MNTEDRKMAVSAYRQREVAHGIYAIRCALSGEVWVGSAPDLSTIQNRLWFTLRQGSNTHASLQTAWTTHGAQAFSFDIVERMDEEPSAGLRNRAMKDRVEHWAETMGASRI